MSFIRNVLDRYNELDEVDRKNLWLGVVGALLLLLLMFSLADVFGNLDEMLGRGGEVVNQSLADVEKINTLK